MLGASAELVEGIGELIIPLWPSLRDINLREYPIHALVLVDILDVSRTGLFKWVQKVERTRGQGFWMKTLYALPSFWPSYERAALLAASYAPDGLATFRIF